MWNELSSNTDNLDWLYRRFTGYLGGGLSRKKEQALRDKLSESPEESDILLELADLLSRKRSSNALIEASEMAQQALSLEPTLAQPYVLLAKVELNRRNIHEAERLARRALSIDAAATGANAVLGLCQIARIARGSLAGARDRSARLALYAKACEYFQQEADIDEHFKPPHSRMAGELFIGRLSGNARRESLLAIRNGQIGLGSILVLLLTFWMSGVFWLFILLLIEVAILINPYVSQTASLMLTPIIGLSILGLLFLVRTRKPRVVILASLCVVLVVAIMTSAIVSKDFRQKALTRPPTSKAIEWSKVDTSTKTPTGTVACFVRASAELDLDTVWSMYSTRAQRALGSKASFQKEYLKSIDELKQDTPESRLVKLDVKLKSENGETAEVWLEPTSEWWGGSGSFGTDVDLVKENGQWRIDSNWIFVI